MTDYIIGVDGGGSKTHAVLVDSGGRIVAESLNGPANIKTDVNLAYLSITSVINELISSHDLGANKIKIGIGVAGYSAHDELDKLKQLLGKNYPNVMIESDCHVACLAAHGNKDGAIVICGTGVVAYYIKDGVGRQIGGWGFPHGDIGGGAWLGLEICRSLCLAIDGVIPESPILIKVFERFDNDKQKYKEWLLSAKPSDYAEIAKTIVEYINFDSNALHIFNAGVNEVSRFIQAVINETHNLPIKLTGGLSQFYVPQLIKHFPDLTVSNNSAAFGASLIVTYPHINRVINKCIE